MSRRPQVKTRHQYVQRKGYCHLNYPYAWQSFKDFPGFGNYQEEVKIPDEGLSFGVNCCRKRHTIRLLPGGRFHFDNHTKEELKSLQVMESLGMRTRCLEIPQKFALAIQGDDEARNGLPQTLRIVSRDLENLRKARVRERRLFHTPQLTVEARKKHFREKVFSRMLQRVGVPEANASLWLLASGRLKKTAQEERWFKEVRKEGYATATLSTGEPVLIVELCPEVPGNTRRSCLYYKAPQTSHFDMHNQQLSWGYVVKQDNEVTVFALS